MAPAIDTKRTIILAAVPVGTKKMRKKHYNTWFGEEFRIDPDASDEDDRPLSCVLSRTSSSHYLWHDDDLHTYTDPNLTVVDAATIATKAGSNITFAAAAAIASSIAIASLATATDKDYAANSNITLSAAAADAEAAALAAADAEAAALAAADAEAAALAADKEYADAATATTAAATRLLCPTQTYMVPKRKAVITATMVIREHGLKKWSVRDDGRCWLYVVMSQLGTYNPTPKRGNGKAKDPTDTELVSAQLICEKLVEDYDADKRLLKGPDYAGERDMEDFFATYGGPREWKLLVQMFDLIVILWDPRRPKDMDDPDKKFLLIFRENGKGIIRDMIPRQIKEKIDTSPVTTKAVHVAWSNTIDAHFDLYM